MFGWKIFTHSVRLVMSNLNVAFRVSGVLYFFYAAIQFWFFRRFANVLAPIGPDDTRGMAPSLPDGSIVMAYFFTLIASLAITLWIAVAWHRFVLLDEAPNSWIPSWHGRNTLGYLGRSILIGLILLATIYIIFLPIGMVAAVTGSFGISRLISIISTVPIISIAISAFVFYRLSSILPAAAIGKPIKMKSAWAATANYNGSFVVIAIVTAIAGAILQFPTWLSGDPASFVSIAFSLVVGWFMMLIGVSTLTTIYGHFIEGRDVD